MASKIESAGTGGRIHISKETAAYLTEAGKGHWLEKRIDKVLTSKGGLQTFWLLDVDEGRRMSAMQTNLRQQASNVSGDSLMEENGWEDQGRPEQTFLKLSNEHESKTKTIRLVGWNCEIMLPLLKMIVARRSAEKKQKVLVENKVAVNQLEQDIGSTINVLEEVAEVISLPRYDAKVQKKIKSNPARIELSEEVQSQLKEYVSVVASLYSDNPFHNVSLDLCGFGSL